MAWGKIDDGMMDHQKIDAALDAGGPWVMVVWLRGLCHAAKGLTDGEISRRAALRLTADTDSPGAALDALVACGLWDQRAGSYWIHDYLDYNPTRAQVLAEREGARKRKETSRSKAKGKAQPESHNQSRRDTNRDNQEESRSESHPPRTRTRTPSRSRPDLPAAAAADLGTSEDGGAESQGQQQPGKGAVKQGQTKAQEADAARLSEITARNAAHAEIVARWCEGLAIRPEKFPAAQMLDLKRAVVDHGPETARAAVEKVLRFRHPSIPLVLRLCKEGLFEEPTPSEPPIDLAARISAAADPEIEDWPTTDGWKPGDAKAWALIQGKISLRLNVHVFDTYFGKLRGFLERDGRRALVGPNPFLCKWVVENYLDFLTYEIDQSLGDGGAVEILAAR